MPEIFGKLITQVFTLPGNIGTTALYYHQKIVEQVGENGAMGLYLCAIVIVLAIVFKIFKLTFNLLRFVIIPALVIGYISSALFSLSFFSITPIAGAACSVLFFIKS